MRRTSLFQFAVVSLVGIGSLGLVAMAAPMGTQSTIAQAPSAVATLRTASGDQVGNATFTSDNGQVAIAISASNLSAGFHGLHVHAVGQCNAPDFTSAGPHFDMPGMMMSSGHAGDLPSLLVNADGNARLETVTDRFSVDDLLDGAGTALIVHAGPDNFGNIPTRYAPAPDATTLATGDAGARLACGVIQAA